MGDAQPTEPPPSRVVEAVMADPHLTPEHKRLVVAIYRALSGRSALDEIDFG